MYCVKVKNGKILTGFSQQTPMEGVGIKNVLDCPELNYVSEQLEEVVISDAEFEQLMEAEVESSKTYARKRKAEYDQLNQFEMQFDDQRDGTTTWVDAINEIKGRYPKNS